MHPSIVHSIPYTVKQYIDITTNAMNTGISGVTGSNNNFEVEIQRIALNQEKKYKLQVVEFSYQNVVVVPATGSLPVRPLITCTQTDPIKLNNVNTNLVYKGQYFAIDTNPIIDSAANGVSMFLDITKNDITFLNFQVNRSDNGQPFPFNNTTNITLLLCLYESMNI